MIDNYITNNSNPECNEDKSKLLFTPHPRMNIKEVWEDRRVWKEGRGDSYLLISC